MSEFDKLMAGETQRPEIQKRNADKRIAWRNWGWIMLGSFVFTLIPPHIGLIVFIPTLLWGAIMSVVETLG